MSAFTTASLQVTLSSSQKTDTTASFSIQTTVKNNHVGPVTVLTWSSPLDPKASALGIIKVHDEDANREIRGPEIKFNRLPPGPDDYVELGVGQKMSVEHVLPWFPSAAGKYRITVEGNWMGLWPRGKAEVLGLEGEDRAREAVRGEFQSNAFSVS